MGFKNDNQRKAVMATLNNGASTRQNTKSSTISQIRNNKKPSPRIDDIYVNKHGHYVKVSEVSGNTIFAYDITGHLNSFDKEKFKQNFIKPTYDVKQNIGKAKYVVSFDNPTQHFADGSIFRDIRIFKNKKDLKNFTNKLEDKGYTE